MLLSSTAFVWEFKGSLTQDFRLQVCSRISFPLASEYPIGAISNFYENSRRYSQFRVDNGDLSLVNLSPGTTTPAIFNCWWQRHRWQFIAGNNNTCDNLSPVTTTPAIIYRRCRWNICNKISLPTPQSERIVKNHYMNVNSISKIYEKNCRQFEVLVRQWATRVMNIRRESWSTVRPNARYIHMLDCRLELDPHPHPPTPPSIISVIKAMPVLLRAGATSLWLRWLEHELKPIEKQLPYLPLSSQHKQKKLPIPLSFLSGCAFTRS